MVRITLLTKILVNEFTSTGPSDQCSLEQPCPLYFTACRLPSDYPAILSSSCLILMVTLAALMHRSLIEAKGLPLLMSQFSCSCYATFDN